MSSCPVLDADAVRSMLPDANVLQILKDLFRDLGQNKAVQPPQTLTLFPNDAGDFITYPAAMTGRGVFGAKFVPLYRHGWEADHHRVDLPDVL